MAQSQTAAKQYLSHRYPDWTRPSESRRNPKCVIRDIHIRKHTMNRIQREPQSRSSKDVVLARRPLPMKSDAPKARETRMVVNYLQVTKLPDFHVNHYDISYDPEIPPAYIRKVFHQFELQHRSTPQMGGNYVVFDGRKNMYSKGELPFGDSHTFMVDEPDDDEFRDAVRHPNGQRITYRMKVREVAVIRLQDLHPFIAGEKHGEQPYEAIMALDIVLRHKPSLRYVTVGRNFYTREGATTLGGGAEVWSGYHQALRPVINSLKINVDVTASAFYEPGDLISMVTKILIPSVQTLTPDQFNREIQERDRQRLAKNLKGVRVETIHRGGSKRFKISNVSNENALQATFQQQNGERITINDYFRNVYNITLRHPQLPLIVVGESRKSQLPIELCKVLPGQRHTRKLNERQTSEMIRFTCRPPSERSKKIVDGVKLFEYRHNEYLEHFEMAVEDTLFVARARILDPPTLMFGANRTEKPVQGGWQFREKRFFDPTILKSWAVMVFTPALGTETVRQFLSELYSTLESTGMKIENKSPLIGPVNPNGNIEESMRKAWRAAGDQAQSRPQLLVCILPNSGVPLYAEIKRVSDTIVGVPSQCLQSKHVIQKKRQYCQNIALKLNVKLGGTNFVVQPQDLGWAISEPTIIIGADVTHANPDEQARGKPSVIALAGSIDSKMGKYTAKLATVPPEQVPGKLSEMIADLVKYFYATVGRVKPVRLIYYRDGVSEGQFGECLQQETKAIRDACASIERGYTLKITYVVVQKRHHTRFFPLQPSDSDRSGNASPGTVIDNDIVHPTDFEFYLQSHAGLQGTSRPGRYTVLYDENALPAEKIQNLTNQLANVFARANKSVSVTTPAYYANLLAARAKFHSRTGFLDSESVASGGGAQGSEYGILKNELSNTMWFM
ncbi:hypothetical protein SeMB42_g01966 [Synchytrium endobioticum]|uniref:Piwi domain-containing protein n=1 Tax=Synchytrium endobioticum TaxID=286115 RepID=A0A507DIE7_9FUNG|nr:hypothetical protein SeLEV6574_g00451 [Synchytrium endobioticum]TPX51316.1 hypothetical protein SeMB42_g01966 [Synchytrium endobioticum]